MNNNTLKIFIMFGAALAVFVGIVTLASGILLISQGAGFNGVITIIGSITNFVLAYFLYKTYNKELDTK